MRNKKICFFLLINFVVLHHILIRLLDPKLSTSIIFLVSESLAFIFLILLIIKGIASDGVNTSRAILFISAISFSLLLDILNNSNLRAVYLAVITVAFIFLSFRHELEDINYAIKIIIIVTGIILFFFPLVFGYGDNPSVNRILNPLLSYNRSPIFFYKEGDAGYILLSMGFLSGYYFGIKSIPIFLIFIFSVFITDARGPIILLFSFASCALLFKVRTLLNKSMIYSLLLIALFSSLLTFLLINGFNKPGERDIFNGRLEIVSTTISAYSSQFSYRNFFGGVPDLHVWFQSVGIDWQRTSHSFIIDVLLKYGILALAFLLYFFYLIIKYIYESNISRKSYYLMTYISIIAYLIFEPGPDFNNLSIDVTYVILLSAQILLQRKG